MRSSRLLAAALLLVVAPAVARAQAQPQATFDPEARLRELGLTLPSAAPPVANYVRAVRTGNLVFLAGHGECGNQLKGKVGAGVTVDSAYQSARRVGLCLLSSLKTEVGDLRKVRRIVKVLGMVNAVEDFGDHPRVINGFSDLMVSVFGERGRHARSAVGMQSLPIGITVEIEMVVEVEP
jgi:enamine deaminase RidA (YjgF/YER057c/UK114 family)